MPRATYIKELVNTEVLNDFSKGCILEYIDEIEKENKSLKERLTKKCFFCWLKNIFKGRDLN